VASLICMCEHSHCYPNGATASIRFEITNPYDGDKTMMMCEYHYIWLKTVWLPSHPRASIERAWRV
jgi:hypothetical protein